MSQAKDIGTRAETAVVRYLRTAGWPGAERRALTGALDQGDITGTPGIAWEVKARKRPPSDEQVLAWLVETEVERANAGAEWGVLVVRRPGVGPANAGRWWAYLSVADVAALAAYQESEFLVRRGALGWPVRMLLVNTVELLHGAGYGTPNGAGGASC
ncbi:hypothetical protein [Actinomadura terrae]|uniref:hypothetical protein n=1 Tax=Actinomadura terrae TaxID=604353 RepID=UPI001FA6BC45|nr:hypothetical protein [Actinomadura terrae]